MEIENCEGVCQEHSGVQQRLGSMSWLIGLLISVVVVMGGAQIKMLMDVREATAGHSTRFDLAAANTKALCERLEALDRRVTMIEVEKSGLPARAIR